jgi:hypothetical protein
MSERPEIVPFEPSDRLCCPGVLAGMDGIFFKPSHSVTFCNLEGKTESTISLILQELRVGSPTREGVRCRTELTRSGQGIGHLRVKRSRCPGNVGGFATGVSLISRAARTP